jgi:hypothetical protein
MYVIPALSLSQQPGYFNTAVGCPWAGNEIENPTQTRVWRGLLYTAHAVSRDIYTDITEGFFLL